jgi:hypothetical protein
VKSKTPPEAPTPREDQESLDPNDSEKESDQLKGQTKLHAKPARLEDEGQSGG